MISVSDIEKMDYSGLVGVVRERNRPSGGVTTINTAVTASRLSKDMKVLEIGCNTGFTSVNIARLVGCRVVGIDINPESIREAQRYSEKMETEGLTSFHVENAAGLSFEDKYFDFVWCSNVTSFINDKSKAIQEYLRVLRCYGTMAVVPIYYRDKPPDSIVEEVSSAISSPLDITSIDDWIRLFNGEAQVFGGAIELYHQSDYVYHDRKEAIAKWVDYVCNKPHLHEYPSEIQRALKKRLTYFIELFNRNLQYCGFSILLFQLRKHTDEPELFHAKSL